jgi:hypothetical protein
MDVKIGELSSPVEFDSDRVGDIGHAVSGVPLL